MDAEVVKMIRDIHVVFKVEDSKVKLFYQLIKCLKELLHWGHSCLPLTYVQKTDKLSAPFLLSFSTMCIWQLLDRKSVV